METEGWDELPNADGEDSDTKSVASLGQVSNFSLDDLEEFKVQLEARRARQVTESVDEEIIHEMRLLEDSINMQAIANMTYKEKVVKVYLPMVGRLLFIFLLTYDCCYVLQSVLKLAYNLVMPVVLILVTWILYSNGGLTSPEGFNQAIENIQKAVLEFFNSLQSIWLTLKEFLNGPM